MGLTVKPFFRRKGLVFGLAAIVALLAAYFSPLRDRLLIAYYDAKIEEWKADRIRRTSGSEPVSVEYLGFHFQIPRNYFKSPQSPGDDTMLLWFLWPDVEPYTPEKHYEFWKATGDESRMVMVLTWPFSNRHAPEDILYVFIQDYVDENKPPRATDFGLYEWSRNDKYRKFGKDIFSDTSTNKIGTLIKCSQIGRVPSPQCRMIILFMDKVFIDINFPRRFLSEWKNIEVSTIRLLASWSVGAAYGAEISSDISQDTEGRKK